MYSLSLFQRLTHLTLSNNRIRDIQPGSFVASSQLHFLGMASNSLSGLGIQSLRGLDNIKEINLSGNLLESFPRQLFAECCPQLERLDLSGNRLESMTSPGGRLFSPRLQVLLLTNNALDSVPTEVLEDTRHLAELTLDGNALRDIAAVSAGCIHNCGGSCLGQFRPIDHTHDPCQVENVLQTCSGLSTPLPLAHGPYL